MSTNYQIKKRGRPKSEKVSLNKANIIENAKEVLFKEKKGLSIRKLASRLSVDPMAIYHYFNNKDDLLEAVCMSYISRIYRPKVADNWQREVKRLIISYIEILRDTPALIETLVSLGRISKGPSVFFEQQFAIATSSLLTKSQLRSAIPLLADFMHGFALGLKYVPENMTKEYFKGLHRSLNLYIVTIESIIKNN